MFCLNPSIRISTVDLEFVKCSNWKSLYGVAHPVRSASAGAINFFICLFMAANLKAWSVYLSNCAIIRPMKKMKFSQVGIGAILLAGSSLLSKFLGVLRDAVFARIFGAGPELDAYFAAFRIPDFLYMLLIFGAMSAAFIPIYTSLLKKEGEDAASLFASRVLNGLLGMLLVACAIAFVFAPWVVPFLAPGFDAETLDLTVSLTRVMLLSPIFLGLSSVFQGVENSHKKFLGIAAAPIAYNLSIVFAALFFGTEFGVEALAWGVVIGAAAHFLVQVPGALRAGFSYSFDLDLKAKDVKEFVRLTIPRLFGISAVQLGLFVSTIIASLLAAGSLSVFNYSMNLQSLPYAVVAVSFSVAVFSTLSEQAVEDDKSEFLRTMRKSTHSILFWVLPAVVGLFLVRDLVVDLILTGGAFDEAAAALTVLTFGVFVWAAIAQSLSPLFARAFYSLHETKRPVLVAFFVVALNASLSLIFTQIYGFGVWSLALAVLVASAFEAGLLVFLLGRKLGVRVAKFFELGKLLKIFVALAVMVCVVLFAKNFAYPNIVVAASVQAGSGGIVYLALTKFMKIIPSLRGR